jgi:superfamily I DNA/RNA helicase
MLSKLKNTSKAKKEINSFKKAIEQIEHVDARNKATELLSQLISQSHLIDMNHSALSVKDLSSKRIRENVESLVSIRKEILKIIKDSKS